MGLATKRNRPVRSHTYTHTSALSHVRSRVCSCTGLHSHTRIRAHSALTYVRSHAGLHAHALILSCTQVLIPRSWLQSWRFTAPKATCLHEAFL